MSLELDNCGFQRWYFVVGTGVVTVPGYGKFQRSEASLKRGELHQVSLKKGTARRGVGSPAWLFKVFGRAKSSATADHSS
jgi:hypothetical protein